MRAALAAAGLLALVTLGLLFGGGLGAPFGADEVPFEAIQREHFDALDVRATRGPASDAPLVVRVHLLGDPAPASYEQAVTWLARHANVRVVEDPDGAPLYMTMDDLAATSGRATLGATLRTGMAVEVRNPNVAPCVLAHEVLHFLGLRHVDDDRNIMSPHCLAGKLDVATLEPWQQDHLDGIQALRAITPGGERVWASR